MLSGAPLSGVPLSAVSPVTPAAGFDAATFPHLGAGEPLRRRVDLRTQQAWVGTLDVRTQAVADVQFPDRLTRPAVPPASGMVAGLVDLRPHPLADVVAPSRLTRPTVPPASGGIVALVDLRPSPLADVAFPDRLARRRAALPPSTTPEVGQADPVVAPDLIALGLVSPLARLTRPQPIPLVVPILDAQPLPGEFTTTVVQGTLPLTILPSGLTPPETP